MNALAGLGPIILDEIVPPRAPWSHRVRRGQTLRIIDLEGNQSADFLMYATDDDTERYSAQDTIAAQRNVYLRQGSMLYSNEGNPMALICSHGCRPPRHHRWRVQLREQHLALWLSYPLAACLRREFPHRQPALRTRQARHGRQYQLVHERAGRSRRHARHCRWHLRPRAARRPAGADGSDRPSSRTARRSTTPAMASIRRPAHGDRTDRI